jgi:hypothetical protein
MPAPMDTSAFAEWLSVDERLRRMIERQDRARQAEGAPDVPVQTEPDGRTVPPPAAVSPSPRRVRS